MSSEWMTLHVFNTLIEAQLAKSKLESEGIDSFIANEHLISIQPLYAQAIGGIRLQVKAEEALAARRILSRDESEDTE